MRSQQRPPRQVAVPVRAPATATRVNPATPSPRRTNATGANPCVGASDLSTRYLQRTSRCAGAAGQQRSSVEPQGQGLTVVSTRSAPVVVVPAARTTFDVTRPPHGYRAAWNDGRLNPQRGPRTLQGDYQSQAVWTNETPRRLRRIILVQQ